MRYQTFGGRTGLRVSEYVLGTANFGSAAPELPGWTDPEQIFEAYVAAGGTTFDVSNIYQGGEAETVLGGLLGEQRDDFVVITKYSGTRQAQPRPGTTGNSRKTMVRSLEESLRRLGTDYVDVFMPHFPDGTTPVAEILAGFDDLIRAGKILHGGLSNFPAWRVAGAATRADLRGLAPLVGIQTEYSLAERSAERELLPMAQAHGLGVVLYSPLAGGLLTGKYRHGGAGPAQRPRTRCRGRRPADRGDRRRAGHRRRPRDQRRAGVAGLAASPSRARLHLHDPDRRPAHPGAPRRRTSRSLTLELGDEHYRAPRRSQRGPARHPPRGRRCRPHPRLRRRPQPARHPHPRHLTHQEIHVRRPHRRHQPRVP